MKSVRIIFVFITIFSLFSSSLFASPPAGGKGPGSKGGKERPGKSPAPREKNPPSSASRSPKSSGGNKDRAKPSDSAKNEKYKDEPKNEIQATPLSPSESSENRATDSQIPPSPSEFSQNPQPKDEPFSPVSVTTNSAPLSEEGEIIFYRGTRTLSDGETLILQNIKSERKSKDELVLEITFSQSINPRSFGTDSILVNGEQISSKTKFTFNKKGDTIKLVVPAKSDTISLFIQDVESFDGTKIEPTQIDIKK